MSGRRYKSMKEAQEERDAENAAEEYDVTWEFRHTYDELFQTTQMLKDILTFYLYREWWNPTRVVIGRSLTGSDTTLRRTNHEVSALTSDSVWYRLLHSFSDAVYALLLGAFQQTSPSELLRGWSELHRKLVRLLGSWPPQDQPNMLIPSVIWKRKARAWTKKVHSWLLHRLWFGMVTRSIQNLERLEAVTSTTFRDWRQEATYAIQTESSPLVINYSRKHRAALTHSGAYQKLLN